MVRIFLSLRGRLRLLTAILLALTVLPAPAGAAEPVFNAAADEPAPNIMVPAGFSVRIIAHLPEREQPTSLAYGPDGALYIAVLGESAEGEIYRLTDDGQLSVYAGKYPFILGIAWRGNDLYFTSLTADQERGQISIARDTNGDHVADDIRVIVHDLPIGRRARHLINGIAFGPDDKLYLANGSFDNATVLTDDERRGTIQRYNPDGSIPADNPKPGSPVFATGLRNPYDLAVHPVTGAVFAADNGRDDMGDNFPPEKLLHILPGRDYGWPECHGINRGECEGAQLPIAELVPHASPTGMAFYTGDQFGPEYLHDLFITTYGAGNPSRRPYYGRDLLRVEFEPQGDTYSARVTTFASGFERPVDVVTARNGGLIVADFGSTNAGTGLIYRIDRAPASNIYASVTAPTGDNAPSYFPETGHTVAADFMEQWQAGGGLAMFGYPLTQEFMEDGVAVQYFERARFERHLAYTIGSSEPARQVVLLGLLGHSVTAGREGEAAFQRTGAFEDSPDRRYFPETGHSLAYGFKHYWDTHGGLTVLGFPISEEFSERNPDTGEVYTVQYFERARFEYHPEFAGTEYEVLLGRLGAQVAGARYR